MKKTITVKGVGRASTRPDTVVLSLQLESRSMQYDRAMDAAADKIEALTRTLVGVGFARQAVKTADFDVGTEYDRVSDGKGEYRRVFRGYRVRQELRVEFPLEMETLSRALSALAGCSSRPEFSIRFIVKDTAPVYEEMLRSAAENARAKAEVLCQAAGVRLGNLVTIDYNWGELDVCSHTRFNLEEDCLAAAPMSRAIDLEPEEIQTSDTVTFLWEIY